MPILDEKPLTPSREEGHIPSAALPSVENPVIADAPVAAPPAGGIETVHILDPKAPIVILYGPTSCGKTMTLVRLANYLRKVLKFTITPDVAFRPAWDKGYKDDCSKFSSTLSDPIAQPGTSGYMLVDVMSHTGKVLCKILEAPGELYFDPKNPTKAFPLYLNTIKHAPNRKVWCAFLEPEWNTPVVRDAYVDRIKALKPQLNTNDRMVFVFNKIDKTPYVKRPGVVDEKLALDYVENYYPNLFHSFRCEIPIIKWFRPYDCSFVPFQTGTFTDGTDTFGTPILHYTPGDDAYVARLWNEIKRSI